MPQLCGKQAAETMAGPATEEAGVVKGRGEVREARGFEAGEEPEGEIQDADEQAGGGS